MVAMTLIVAAVIVVSLLQGQSDEFGDFSDERTDSSGCEFQELEYARALDECTETQSASEIQSSASDDGCDWADNPDPNDYC